jgi:glycosyltransferase involved in cell wall biosynthesis
MGGGARSAVRLTSNVSDSSNSAEGVTRVLILQDVILHYRVPIYNSLASLPHIALTVAHSVPLDDSLEVEFKTIQFPVRRRRMFVRADVRAIIDACDPDVVIALFDLHWIDIVLLALSRHRQYSLILWGIGRSSQRGYRNRALLDRARTFVARRADVVLLYSERARNLYLASGFSRDRVIVAPNTIHVSEPRALGPDGSQELFLFIGSLRADKGLEELIDAFALAVDSFARRVGLLIVGEGPAREALEDRVEQLGMRDLIRFYGPAYNSDEREALFGRAIACISPSQAGLSVLLSMAYGVPFVTRSDAITGGERFNISSGVNGVEYSGGARELSQALTSLVNDRERTTQLGRRALAHYLEHATSKRMLEGFQSAIERAQISRRRESPGCSVVVNAASARIGGGGTVLQMHVGALLAAQSNESIMVILSRRDIPLPSDGRLHTKVLPRLPVWLRVPIEQVYVPLLARRLGASVIYCLGSNGLLYSRCPTVVLLQAPLHFRALRPSDWCNSYSRRKRLRYDLESRFAQATVRRASAIVAVSATLAHAAQSEWTGVDQRLVVLPSVAPDFPEVDWTPPATSYCLFVANDYPHKEWCRVRELFERFSDLPPLLIAGASLRTLPCDLTVTPLDEAFEGSARVSWIGPVHDRAILAALFSGARVVLVHSRSESFGLTLVEAASLNGRVAAADLPAHREVAGHRRILWYDPSDPGALVACVRAAATCKDEDEECRAAVQQVDLSTALSDVMRLACLGPNTSDRG